jgi:hypothetical protein
MKKCKAETSFRRWLVVALGGVKAERDSEFDIRINALVRGVASDCAEIGDPKAIREKYGLRPISKAGRGRAWHGRARQGKGDERGRDD